MTAAGASKENYKKPGREAPSSGSDPPASSTGKVETLKEASSNIASKAIKDGFLVPLIMDRDSNDKSLLGHEYTHVSGTDQKQQNRPKCILAVGMR